MPHEYAFPEDWHAKWKKWYEKRLAEEMARNYAVFGYAVPDSSVGQEPSVTDLFGEMHGVWKETRGGKKKVKDMTGWKPSRVPDTLREWVEGG